MAINLLPWRENALNAFYKELKWIVISSILILSLAIILTKLIIYFRYQQQMIQVNNWQYQLMASTKKVNKEINSEQIGQIQVDIKMNNRLIKQLKWLEINLPMSIYLTKFNYNNKSISIEGITSLETDLISFYERIASAEIFGKITGTEYIHNKNFSLSILTNTT